MKIRDSFAKINGDSTEYEMPSGGIEIVSESGHTLFSINLIDAVLQVSSGSVCRHNGVMYDDKYLIEPRASNLVYLHKQKVSTPT